MSVNYQEKEIKFYAMKYFDKGEMKEPKYSIEIRIEDEVVETIETLSDINRLTYWLQF